MTNEIKTNKIKKEALTAKIHEFTINNREEGYDILERNGIDINIYLSRKHYSMNAASGNYYIGADFNKTNNENIDFIYCVQHYKTFGPSYSQEKILDYYKNHKGRISDLYIFKKSDEWLKKEQAWLNQQPDIKIHEYTINNREEGYKILEQNGINIDRNRSYDDTSMNTSGDNYISANFDKTNNENIDFIYCIKRDNPWGIRYKAYQTLDYYKNNKIAIKTIYIFKK